MQLSTKYNRWMRTGVARATGAIFGGQAKKDRKFRKFRSCEKKILLLPARQHNNTKYQV